MADVYNGQLQAALGGAGFEEALVLPDPSSVRRGRIFLRSGDETLWKRHFEILPAEAAVDASLTTANFSTVVIGTHTWYEASNSNPYPADNAGVFFKIDEETFYIKAAGSLAGSMTTGTPTYNTLYNDRGPHATEPTGTHANNDIYFNTTDGNWYIYVTNRYSNVANPASLFAGTNAVWLPFPLDSNADVLQLWYQQGTYVAGDTYYFYNGTAVVEVTGYTPTTTDWEQSTLGDVSTLSGAFAYYGSEADAIAAIESGAIDISGLSVLILDLGGDDLLLMTDFTASVPAVPERENPIWIPVNENLRYGNPVVNVADAAALATYFTNNPNELTQYDENSNLLVSVGTAVQRRINNTWEDVSGWVRGAVGPEPSTARLNTLISPLLTQAITDNDLQNSTQVTSLVNTILGTRDFQTAAQVMSAIATVLSGAGYLTASDVTDFRSEAQIQVLIDAAVAGLSSGEFTISVQFTNDGGTTWEDTLAIYSGVRIGAGETPTEWHEIDLGSTSARISYRGDSHDMEETYQAGDYIWHESGTTFSGFIISRQNNNVGNVPPVRERDEWWDILSGSDITQIEEFYAAEERLPDATTSWRLVDGTAAGLDGLIEPNPVTRWYPSIGDIPDNRQHLTKWRCLLHVKNYGQVVSPETPTPVIDPGVVARTRAEIESNFPVIPLDTISDFSNFAHWGFARAATAEAGIDIADITFVDADGVALESDVTFESNNLGRLSLYELGARASRLRSANNTVGRISIRVSGLYASVVGTIGNSPSKLNVTGTGYIEIAFSIEHTHVEWTTIAPNGEPLGRAVGPVVLTEASPADTSTHAYVLSARIEPTIGTTPSLRFGTADGSLAIYAQDAQGIRFQSAGLDFPTPRGTWSTALDINDFFIVGFVQDETGGDSDYQFFANNILSQFMTSGTTDPSDSIVLQVSYCDIGDIFWTDTLSTNAIIDFAGRIIREPFGDGLYGLLYRRADVLRETTLDDRITDALSGFLQRSTTNVATAEELAAIDVSNAGAIRFAYVTTGFDTYTTGDLLVHNGTDWVVITNVAAANLANFLQRSGTNVATAEELAAVNTAPNGTVAFARVTATFDAYTQGDLLFHNGTAWVVISQASAVDLTNFLQRSGTSVANATQLGDIAVAASGTIAFARVTAAFDTYVVGDLLFHDGSNWIVIAQTTTANLGTFLQRSVTSVNNATQLGDIAVAAAGTIAFARVATTFGGHAVGTVLFHDGSDWQTLAVPGTSETPEDGDDGRRGLSAVARTYTGTFVAQADVDSEGEINSTDNGTTGTLTMFLATADQDYWSNLRVDGLFTVRVDDDNYLQGRVTAVLGSVSERQYSFEVLDLVGTVNGSTGTVYVDSGQPEDGEDGEDATGRRGLTAVAETYQVTLRDLADVDSGREAHWTDDGDTGTLTLFVNAADKPYWENLSDAAVFTLRVDDDNYAQVRITGSSGSDPIAYTVEILDLVGRVNNRVGETAYVDSAKSPRGRFGRVAVNRSITRTQSGDETPTTAQVRVSDNSIILNHTATDVDAGRLAGLPNGTPISLESTIGTIYRTFRTSGVAVSGDYTTISFTELDESMGAVGVGTEFLITFGDVQDGDPGTSTVTFGRHAVNRSVTKLVGPGVTTPVVGAVGIDTANDAIYLNLGATDLDSDRLQNLPVGTPLSIFNADSSKIKAFSVLSVSYTDPYLRINYSTLDTDVGTFTDSESVTVAFGDAKDGGEGGIGLAAISVQITRAITTGSSPTAGQVSVSNTAIIHNTTGTGLPDDYLDDLVTPSPITLLSQDFSKRWTGLVTTVGTAQGNLQNLTVTWLGRIGEFNNAETIYVGFGFAQPDDAGVTALVRSVTVDVSDADELDAIDVSDSATVAFANVNQDFDAFRQHDLLFYDGSSWRRIYYISYQYSHTGTGDWQNSRDDDEEYGRIVINGIPGISFQLPNAVSQATTKLIKERDNVVREGYIEFLQYYTWAQSVRFGNFPAHGLVLTDEPNVWKCVADRVRFVVNGVTDTNHNTLGAINDPGADTVTLTETVIVVDVGYNPDDGTFVSSHNIAEQEAGSLTVNENTEVIVNMVDLADSVDSEFVLRRDEHIRIRVVPTPAQTNDFHIVGRTLRVAITAHTEIAPLEIEINGDYLRAVDPSLPENLRYQNLYQFSSRRVLGAGEDDLIIWVQGQSSRLGPNHEFGGGGGDLKIPLSGIINENPYDFQEDIFRFIAAADVHSAVDGGRAGIDTDTIVFELNDGLYDLFFAGEYLRPGATANWRLQFQLNRIRYTGSDLAASSYRGITWGNDRVYILQDDGTNQWIRVLNEQGDPLTNEDTDISGNGNAFAGITVLGDEVLVGQTQDDNGVDVVRVQRYSLDLGTVNGAFNIDSRVTEPIAIAQSGDRVHILDQPSIRNGIIHTYNHTFQRYLGSITLPELTGNNRYRGLEVHPDGGFYVLISTHTGTAAGEIKRYTEPGVSLVPLDYDLPDGRYYSIARYPIENNLLVLDDAVNRISSYNDVGHLQDGDERLAIIHRDILGAASIDSFDILLEERAAEFRKTEQLYFEITGDPTLTDTPRNLNGYLIVRRKRRI